MTLPYTGKHASLGEALMTECAPGKPMPEWLYESLCMVFDAYARGDIKDLADALGLKALRPARPGAVDRKMRRLGRVYSFVAALKEQNPSISLTKKKPNGAYYQAGQKFGISASQAEKEFEKYRYEVILKFGTKT